MKRGIFGGNGDLSLCDTRGDHFQEALPGSIDDHGAAADPQQIIVELRRQLDERTAQLDEALGRETATAEVCRLSIPHPVISHPYSTRYLPKH